MLRTIAVGNHLQIQGLFVRKVESGKVIVAVGDQEYEGKPVGRKN